jgi:hypothetical protein
MPENPEAEVKQLVTRMRKTADTLIGIKSPDKPVIDRICGAMIDLRQGANTVEDLLVLESRAFYGRFRHAITTALYDFIVAETGWQPNFTWEPHDKPGLLLQVTCGDHGPIGISLHIQIEREQLTVRP